MYEVACRGLNWGEENVLIKGRSIGCTLRYGIVHTLRYQRYISIFLWAVLTHTLCLPVRAILIADHKDH